MASNVIVAVRVRPPNSVESCSPVHRPIIQHLSSQCILFDPAHASPDAAPGHRRSKDLPYKFDHVFGPDTTQQQVYAATAGRVVDKVVAGFNATVFAYGATGSGKTHTMVGSESHPGVMVQCVQDLFTAVSAACERAGDTHHKSFEVCLSYLEVYNESIRDLLVENSPGLALQEDKSGVSIRGLTQKQDLKSAHEVFMLLKQGNARRSQCATDQNETSSRSHAVLQICIKKFDVAAVLATEAASASSSGAGASGDDSAPAASAPAVSSVVAPTELWTSKLSLIDLAGSERAAGSKNRGNILKEGANINKSLLALGNVISALALRGRNEVGGGAKGGALGSLGRRMKSAGALTARPKTAASVSSLGSRTARTASAVLSSATGGSSSSSSGASSHIPYRGSKLTRLLKDSLGGSCTTVMIAAVSPSSLSREDTHNTLKYADRAKQIKVEARMVMLNRAGMVGASLGALGLGFSANTAALQEEIKALKEQVAALQREKAQWVAAKTPTDFVCQVCMDAASADALPPAPTATSSSCHTVQPHSPDVGAADDATMQESETTAQVDAAEKSSAPSSTWMEEEAEEEEEEQEEEKAPPKAPTTTWTESSSSSVRPATAAPALTESSSSTARPATAAPSLSATGSSLTSEPIDSVMPVSKKQKGAMPLLSLSTSAMSTLSGAMLSPPGPSGWGHRVNSALVSQWESEMASLSNMQRDLIASSANGAATGRKGLLTGRGHKRLSSGEKKSPPPALAPSASLPLLSSTPAPAATISSASSSANLLKSLGAKAKLLSGAGSASANAAAYLSASGLSSGSHSRQGSGVLPPMQASPAPTHNRSTSSALSGITLALHNQANLGNGSGAAANLARKLPLGGKLASSSSATSLGLPSASTASPKMKLLSSSSSSAALPPLSLSHSVRQQEDGSENTDGVSALQSGSGKSGRNSGAFRPATAPLSILRPANADNGSKAAVAAPLHPGGAAGLSSSSSHFLLPVGSAPSSSSSSTSNATANLLSIKSKLLGQSSSQAHSPSDSSSFVPKMSPAMMKRLGGALSRPMTAQAASPMRR